MNRILVADTYFIGYGLLGQLFGDFLLYWDRFCPWFSFLSGQPKETGKGRDV